MFDHLKEKLVSEWHLLVLGTKGDAERVLHWIANNHERKLLMTLADDIKAIKDAVSAPAVIDLKPALDAIAGVDVKADKILAELTLTPVAQTK